MTTDLDRFELARQRLAAPKPVDVPLSAILGTTEYRVHFSRVGREYDITTTIDAASPEELADAILAFTRRFHGSRDRSVGFSESGDSGDIWCGFRQGASFTITPAVQS